MNLHDWIDELCDALDLDAEIDEGLVLDMTRVVAHGVERPAAPISAYLLGLAAGSKGLLAKPEEIEALVEKTVALAEGWDRPGGAEQDTEDEAEELEESEVDEEE
ncbi:DUF6457 domain-containing protein [Nocardioides bruguierae]|uniref:DUF6457 domain-containing protein n=1 Tax=Nocardioides bruguierae TaxID=2945102 RepID=A0A9X2D830_9ACTN|nr:DUF6457 domain-containing protein [Nocardioides bruguierae]MCL8025291.1 DUF6457 domain-containing protein [Nocardioides bruguierae]MCM0621103.1 DUF6457 domain-containing protein [Nocardioides bruguierae]